FSARKLTGLTLEAKKHFPDFVMHPLVRTRPDTGLKTLYFNQIRIEAIEGLEEAETQELLDALIDHATQTKYQYRHKWRLNDLVIWQSRCLLHQANGDYNRNQTGYLYRVMPQGDAPY
ncbi:MAG: TauD/TfdA family dioxygenase, partial [Pseudomonadota bacterium]|nr:TauD/TfdA family dioxygenase [Pseudomonadota bacterium]